MGRFPAIAAAPSRTFALANRTFASQSSTTYCISSGERCQFTGVNDPSAVVLLQWLTDPGDRQSFLDLQVSLGEPERIRTSGLTDGRIGPDGTVWVDRDGTVYTVLVSVTGEPASDQSDRATDVLAAWLKG